MIAIRGATTAAVDDEGEILSRTRELLEEIARRNTLVPERIVSVIFTCTADLRSAFPARAAREMGWTQVPLLCMAAQEMNGALARCIRVLLHVERGEGVAAARHVYLREASDLRPDLGAAE